jgi:hypothetical protein
MYQYEVVVNQVKQTIVVETNSNVTDFRFDETASEIAFKVSGAEGTRGFCNVTIPKTLVKPEHQIKVYLNGEPLNFELSESPTYYYIYFEYQHSTHHVAIRFETKTETRTATITTAQPITTTVTQTHLVESTPELYGTVIAATVIAAGAATIIYLMKRRES